MIITLSDLLLGIWERKAALGIVDTPGAHGIHAEPWHTMHPGKTRDARSHRGTSSSRRDRTFESLLLESQAGFAAWRPACRVACEPF